MPKHEARNTFYFYIYKELNTTLENESLQTNCSS